MLYVQHVGSNVWIFDGLKDNACLPQARLSKNTDVFGFALQPYPDVGDHLSLLRRCLEGIGHMCVTLPFIKNPSFLNWVARQQGRYPRITLGKFCNLTRTKDFD